MAQAVLELSPSEAVGFKIFFLVAFVIYVYDWLITLDVEVERIWCQTRTSFVLLWCALRYGMIFGLSVTAIFLFGHWSEDVCDQYSIVPTAFTVSATFNSCAIFMLRTYALYGRKNAILWVGGLFGAGSLAYSFVVASRERLVHTIIIPGCFPALPQHIDGFLVWLFPFLFNTVILVATTFKTVQVMRQTKMPLMTLILRDGTLFYIVIFLGYVLHLVIFFRTSDKQHDFNSAFNSTITFLATERLVLNLRGVAAQPTALPSTVGRTNLTGLRTIADALDTSYISNSVIDDDDPMTGYDPPTPVSPYLRK